MNPHSEEMQKVYRSFCALEGLDENCAAYITFAQEHSQQAPTTAIKTENKSTQYDSALQTAIVKGLKEKTGELTRKLLETEQPLEIVQKEIIPALNIVGVGFKNKTVYLPELLMSAEAENPPLNRSRRVSKLRPQAVTIFL